MHPPPIISYKLKILFFGIVSHFAARNFTFCGLFRSCFRTFVIACCVIRHLAFCCFAFCCFAFFSYNRLARD